MIKNPKLKEWTFYGYYLKLVSERRAREYNKLWNAICIVLKEKLKSIWEKILLCRRFWWLIFVLCFHSETNLILGVIFYERVPVFNLNLSRFLFYKFELF